MGEVFFSIDLELLKVLKGLLPLETFVETGTFQGNTTAILANMFGCVHTVERSEELFVAARQKLAGQPNVELHHGSSPTVLTKLSPSLTGKSVGYWLDAHWCGSNTAGHDDECPLLAEIASIGRVNSRSVVLIDDARLFLAAPPLPHDASQWPDLTEIISALTRLSPDHRISVINDIIVFYPSRFSADIAAYSRRAQSRLEKMPQSGQTNSPAGEPHRLPAGGNRLSTPGRLGLNEECNASQRSERLFAYHLNQAGITRLLDIGAHSGEFVRKLRSFGYQGFVHSVEPQRTVHARLREAARNDIRWLPIPRQCAGSEPGWLELNISENSWSTSLLEVHPNHLRAEASTRTVTRERVDVVRAENLLNRDSMDLIEAIKIDVQGYERHVLEGLQSVLPHVRLLLLEMSIVECYRGAADLFELDRHLTEDCGFQRVSLEPAYYDEKLGVVQQYDGIYRRPSAAVVRDRPAVALASVLTSLPPTLQRTGPGGVEVGPQWLAQCCASWSSLAPRVLSVSENRPPVPGIEWREVEERPSIAALCRAGAACNGPAMLVNADIACTPQLREVLATLDPEAVYYGNRVDVVRDSANPQQFAIKGVYELGFDFFVLPKQFLVKAGEQGRLPENFRIGEPWWDYLLPLLAIAWGFPVKRMPIMPIKAVHYFHETRYAHEIWQRNGADFLHCIQAEVQQADCFARGVLTEILDGMVGGDQDEQLNALSGRIVTTIL